MQGDSPEITLPTIVSLILYFGGAIALIGVLPIDSFGFYMFLRSVLFISFVVSFIAMLSYLEDRMEIFLIAPAGALLFNPFSIVEHEKATWIIFDLIAGCLLIFWAYSINRNIERDRQHARMIENNTRELLLQLDMVKKGSGSNADKYHESIRLITNAKISVFDEINFKDYAKQMYKK